MQVGTETGRLFDSGRFLESRALGEMNKIGHDKNDSKDEKLHYNGLMTKRIKKELGFLKKVIFYFQEFRDEREAGVTLETKC